MKNPTSPVLSPRSPDALAADYYLTNLQCLLTHVAGLYDDVLTESERLWHQDFLSLPRDCQKLYARLLMRKGPLFRLDRLAYPEIDDLPAAAEQLQTRNFLSINPSTSPEALLKLFTRPELSNWFELPTVIKPKLRQDQEAALVAQYSAQDIAARIQRQTHWCCLLRCEVFSVFQYLFFGNAHQDLAEFVMTDLGIVRYESYAIAHDQRFFQSRTRLDTLMHLANLKAIYWEAPSALSGADIEQMLAELPEPVDDAYLQRKTDQLRNLLARQLERLGSTDTALALYQRSMAPPARERAARLYSKAGNTELALQLCQAILANPLDPDEKEFAEQFASRLQGKRNARKAKQPLCTEDWLYIARPDSESIYVEGLVAEHYQQQGWLAIHLENALFNGLLGLFFWDIIFAPVSDAFFNPFQRGPRDLFRPEFRSARADLIEQRLAELNTTDWPQRILATAKSKRDIANNLVNWSAFDDQLLTRITEVIPGRHLQVIFDRILDHPGFYRNGFPDLLLIHPDGQYRLAEVKGPGDTLQANQIRWIRYFSEHAIPVQVAWLRWQEPQHGE